MRTPTALGVIAGMAALAAAQLFAQSRPVAKRFTLSGTVVDEKGQPVSGAELTLESSALREPGDPANSDGQGRFAFAGLPAGEYILSAKVRGVGTIPYGDGKDPVSIRLGAEHGDKSVVFRVVPRGFVEGSIRDEFGDPMANLNVAVQWSSWSFGKLRQIRFLQRITDDRGHYRFGNLAPGTYQVCIAGGTAPAPVAGPVDFNNRNESRYFGRTCSRPVQVAPGQRAQMDLTPTTITAATVRGHVSNLAPQTGFNAFLAAYDDTLSENRSAFIDATQGTFTFHGVAPGQYLLSVSTNSQDAQKSGLVEMPLDIGSDIDGLEVQLGARATADIAFHGGATRPTALLRLADRNAGFRSAMVLQGSERGPVLIPPGRYWLDVPLSGNDCVESIKLGDREIREGTFDVSAGAALHFGVAISQSCGAVTARAVRDGAAVAGATVVLAPSGGLDSPRGLKQGVTDDEGMITLTGLSPGRYLMWSWATSGAGAMAGPSSLTAVEAQATTVDVTAGDPKNVDVPLLANEGKLP